MNGRTPDATEAQGGSRGQGLKRGVSRVKRENGALGGTKLRGRGESERARRKKGDRAAWGVEMGMEGAWNVEHGGSFVRN